MGLPRACLPNANKCRSGRGLKHHESPMKSVDDAAYAMAALSAAVVLFRALIKKGLLTREEAVRIILDEAVSQAIQAEAQDPRAPGSEANRQCAEILKLIAERL
jgi:hypothetical protein